MYTPEIINEEEALAAVKENGWALGYVPENLKNAEWLLGAARDYFEIILERMPGEVREEVRRRLG